MVSWRLAWVTVGRPRFQAEQSIKPKYKSFLSVGTCEGVQVAQVVLEPGLKF